MSERHAAPATGAGRDLRNLVKRIAAAAVLAPLAVAAAYAGSWLWIALVTAATIGLYFEWLGIVGTAGEMRSTAAGTVALALAGVSLAFGQYSPALLVLVLGIAGAAALAPQRRGWSAAGFAYAAAAELAAVLVRADARMGFVALIFILLIVWATDIGGYFAGRGLGGPKLWPRVSPNKTWAGAVGGFLGSLIVAVGFAVVGVGRILPLLAVAGGLSIVGQLGDLFESAVKRRFGVKDSGHTIPGHGGLMDRLDSLVAVLVLAAILGALRYGMDGVGRGLMVW